MIIAIAGFAAGVVDKEEATLIAYSIAFKAIICEVDLVVDSFGSAMVITSLVCRVANRRKSVFAVQGNNAAMVSASVIVNRLN